jgi:hypothetical protein
MVPHVDAGSDHNAPRAARGKYCLLEGKLDASQTESRSSSATQADLLDFRASFLGLICSSPVFLFQGKHKKCSTRMRAAPRVAMS